MYRFILLTSLFLFIFSPSKGQTTTKVTDSGWRFGLNIGGAYQGKPFGQKELEPAFGMGWGMTVGRKLYKEEGAFFDLGLRGRFLWEMSKGVSTEPHYAIGVHPRADHNKRFDFDQVGQRYQDSVGHLYPNYRQEGRQYDLELTLGFNRWAERTNVLFYLFGGIGVINYQVRTDQLNNDGSIYRYDQHLDGNPSRGQLQKLWDGDYETLVYEGGKIDRFIPSAGLGAIYQVTPSLGIGFEHKIGFPDNEDRFDAVEFERGFDPQDHSGGEAEAYDRFQKTSRQDLYHYTSLTFRLRIVSGPEDKGSQDDPSEQDPTTQQHTGQDGIGNVDRPESPKVTITRPPSTPFRTEMDSFELKAEIRNVVKEENVTLTVDGEEFASPGLDLANNVLSQNIALEEGGNRIHVQAVNQRGNDADKVLIVRKADTLPAPKVRVTEPSQTPHTTYHPQKALEANVLNVEEKDDIRFLFNGSPHSFRFDTSTGGLDAELELIQGANVVDIKARNSVGEGRDERTIIYRKEAGLEPPRVRFSYPENDPHVVYQPHATLRARVKGITSRYDITVQHNEKNVEDFNYYPGDGILTMDPSLKPGNNIFKIQAEDEGGTDEAQCRIVLADEDRKPPVVRFRRPASSGMKVHEKEYRMVAFVDHVHSRDDIELKMNGTERSGFAFNSSEGKLVYDAELQEGVNRFRVHASDPMGADVEERSIRYERTGSGPSPSIKIMKPAKDPYRTSEEKPFISAQVDHVKSKNNLKVQVNGTLVTSYQFDPASGKFGLEKGLVEGRNRITIEGFNGNGSDRAELTIVHVPQEPPVVNIIEPSGSSVKAHRVKYSLEAKLTRVPSSSDIDLILNGNSVSDLAYDPKSGELLVTFSLQEGMNKVILKGQNEVGSDEDRVKIRYESPKPPRVKIEKPSADPHQTNQNKITIKGKVLNVDGAQDLTLKANGQFVQNFQYRQSGRFKYSMSLQPGSNKFEVMARNMAGQAVDSRIIQRNTVNFMRGKDDDGTQQEKDEAIKDEVPGEPEVSIESPSSKETTVKGVRVKARIVNGKTIELFVNGNSHPYSLDGDRLMADVPLQKGENRIRVKVTNETGSAEDEVSIEFEPVKGTPGGKKKPDPDPKDTSTKDEDEPEDEEDKEKTDPEPDDDDPGGGDQLDDPEKEKTKEKKEEDAEKGGEQVDQKKDKEKKDKN